MDTYSLIIGVSLIIIISFFFNIISKKTNIPSVLLLIALGVLIKEFAPASINVDLFVNLGVLEIIGNVGLVMIVLEAALDLKLTKDKRGLIINSFFVALIALVVSSFGIAGIIYYLIPGADSFYNCMVYAVPLSIMSSAIIIPSVGGLTGAKKEFMVYESTFSDILGIMFFYFLIGADQEENFGNIAIDIAFDITLTLVVSIVLAYILVFIFQRLTSQVKLFLVIAVLMLMYALGKKLHLSSLLIILAFGLVLNNVRIFFIGKKMQNWVSEATVKPILHDFHILTLESAFVIRTFFFVIFGMSITIASILDYHVALISLAIIGLLYLVRFILLKLIVGRDITPQLYIAPRGLITILLFFVVTSHKEFVIENFDAGILLFVVLISSIIMTIALIAHRGENVREVLLGQLPKIKIDKNKNGVDDRQDRINDNVESQDYNQFDKDED